MKRRNILQILQAFESCLVNATKDSLIKFPNELTESVFLADLAVQCNIIFLCCTQTLHKVLGIGR